MESNRARGGPVRAPCEDGGMKPAPAEEAGGGLRIVRRLQTIYPDESATRLTFSLSGESGLQKTLILGTNGVAGGVYATVQGQDAVFVIARETAVRLTRSMVLWQ